MTETIPIANMRLVRVRSYEKRDDVWDLTRVVYHDGRPPLDANASAGGWIEGPASEFYAGATYTFQSEIDGQWFQWVGQRPVIEGDRARFYLRDGVRIERPTDVAEGDGIEPSQPEGCTP